MAKEIVVSIPHDLTRQEAASRVRGGLDRLVALIKGYVQVEQGEWANDSIHLSLRAFGQGFAATIIVEDHQVTIKGTVPLILSAFAEPARKFVEQRGALLLEKPGRS